MIIPLSFNTLLYNGTSSVIQSSIGKIILLLLLHLYNDMLTFICNAVDIKDNTTLIWSQTKFLRFSKRHILDYQLSIKQSVQECYQALFSVLAPKNTLESPVHTWVYISCHTINNFMGHSRNIAFRPQIYDFILKPPKFLGIK